VNPADRTELSALVHRYAAAVDDRDIEAVVELLTPDAELVLPTPPDVLTPVQAYRGADGIRAALDAVTAVGRTHHSIDSEVYRGAAEDDVAHGRIGGTAHHWTRHHDTITDLVWYLRYDDDYRRTASGWLIGRRTLTIDAIETRPARRMR
jgi:ketosteroid isomerase-like protein